MVAPWDGADPKDDVCEECFATIGAETMTPTEKIARRVLLIERLCRPYAGEPERNPRYEDFWSSDTRSWHRLDRSDLYPALAQITNTRLHEMDWLKEKADDINQKGMLWFMDWLDEEHLGCLLDPTVDVFPSIGI